MTLPDSDLIQFFLIYGYWIALPLMVIIGPLATITMAAIASFGYFNPIAVFVLGFTADLIGDTIFYSLGYYFGAGIIRRFGRFVKLSEDKLPAIQDFYETHGGKSIFLAKILTGVVPPVFIFAGYSKMDLKKFYGYAALGGAFWSAGMVALGYYLGREFQSSLAQVESIFTETRVILILLLAFFLFYKFYLHRVIERHLRYLSELFKKK
jgi:membrane protein DedA with SNARE-associated domain